MRRPIDTPDQNPYNRCIFRRKQNDLDLSPQSGQDSEDSDEENDEEQYEDSNQPVSKGKPEESDTEQAQKQPGKRREKERP